MNNRLWYSSSKAAMNKDRLKDNVLDKEFNRWYNKNGTLKVYALSCGAMETYLKTIEGKEYFICLKYENGFYQVSWLFSDTWERMVFDTLSHARNKIKELQATV